MKLNQRVRWKCTEYEQETREKWTFHFLRRQIRQMRGSGSSADERESFGSGYDKDTQDRDRALRSGGGLLGQRLFDVQVKGSQKWPSAEADKLYLSACAAVQKEFRSNRPIRPQIILVLGAEKNEARLETREIRLTKWNSYLFTQGVVILAFEDLMPMKDRMAMARRAVSWPTRALMSM